MGFSVASMLAVLVLTMAAEGDPLVWRRAFVSLTRLFRSELSETFPLAQKSLFPHYAVCAPMCGEKAWCRVWCLDAASPACIFSDVRLLEGHVEPFRMDTVPCYTTRRDLATGASITGSDEHDTERMRTNLVDGFYSTYDRECFVGLLTLFPYVVVDLGSPKTLQRVTLIMEDSNNAQLQKNYELRVGTMAVDPSHLNTYQFFGSFAGPATAAQVVVVEAPQPVTARYVSVQMLEYQWFVFCHLEIE